MALYGSGDPRWVDALLDWRWTWPLCRVALTSAYWVGGLTKLLDWQAAVDEAAGFGLHPAGAAAALTIVVELVGSALVIAGRGVWLGAGALGVFTLLASGLANDFWNREGGEHFTALNGFLEHLGLIAGLVLAAHVAKHRMREPQARRGGQR